MEALSIKIKYFGDVQKIQKIAIGDWIDLRAAEDMEFYEGDFNLIPLGVAMELPEGYEAHVVARSSTMRHFGLIQTNGVGIIDNSYSGDNDEWKMPVYATQYTNISKGDRVCQFRIIPKMPPVNFIEVEHLNNPDRGGFGSTGVR